MRQVCKSHRRDYYKWICGLNNDYARQIPLNLHILYTILIILFLKLSPPAVMKTVELLQPRWFMKNLQFCRLKSDWISLFLFIFNRVMSYIILNLAYHLIKIIRSESVNCNLRVYVKWFLDISRLFNLTDYKNKQTQQ